MLHIGCNICVQLVEHWTSLAIPMEHSIFPTIFNSQPEPAGTSRNMKAQVRIGAVETLAAMCWPGTRDCPSKPRDEMGRISGSSQVEPYLSARFPHIYPEQVPNQHVAPLTKAQALAEHSMRGPANGLMRVTFLAFENRDDERGEHMEGVDCSVTLDW